MKKIYLLVLGIVLLCDFSIYSQTYNMPNGANGTNVTCSGTFRDGAGNYGASQNSTITFCPTVPTDKIRISFTAFDTESIGATCYDYLDMWHANAAGPVGTQADRFCGTLAPFVVTSISPDGCISFRFTSDASFQYAGWTATISCVTPCVPPTAALVTASTVDICSSNSLNPGSTTVAFDASNSTTPSGSLVRYEWDWGDGTNNITATPTTTHTFPTTGGLYLVRLRVRNNNFATDPLGCLSSNSVTRTIRVMPEPLFTGTSGTPIPVTCGNSVTLNGQALSQTIVQATPAVISGPVNLPDGSGSSYNSTLDFSGLFPPGATMTAGCYPTISFDIEHSYTGDLDISLISPTGETVLLFDQHAPTIPGHFGLCSNGATDGVAGCPATYTVVNTGGASWTAVGSTTAGPPTVNGACAYTGVCETGGSYYIPQTYTSTNPFTTLNGAALNGVWTLRVTDNISSDDGVLSNWSLTFPAACYANLLSETPDLVTATWSHSGAGPVIPAQTTTSVVVNNPGPSCPAPGPCVGNELSNDINLGPFPTVGMYTYTFTVTDEYGCQYDRDVVVDVTCPCNLTLTSAAATTNQTLCLGNAINNIAYSFGGSASSVNVTGLPAGVTASIVGTNVTISGTPSATGTFNYTVTTVGCTPNLSLNGTIVVNPGPVFTSLTSNSPICENSNAEFYLQGTPNSTVTYDIDGGASQNVVLNGAGTATVVVPSVTANTTLTTSLITSTATPVVGNGLSATGGNIPANSTGGISALGAAANAANCASVDNTNSTLTITLQHTVPAGTTVTLSIARDNNQGNVNISDGTAGIGTFNAGPNDVLQRINVVTTVATNTIVITRANGIVWVDGVQYTFTPPGCSVTISNATTVTVNPTNTISLTSAVGTDAQSICVNSSLTNITYATTGATGATITGLPAGVTGSWSGNVVTISGTPTTTVGSPFNYTVTLTGGCGTVSTVGTITVNPILMPTINCGASTTTSVQFTWAAVSGATSYTVSYTINGGAATPTTNIGNVTSYTINSLTAGDSVQITLTPVGGAGTCFTFSVLTCNANACIPPALPLSSAVSSDSQTICINTPLTNIVYTLVPGSPAATNVTLSAGAFPAGVTGSFSGGVYTISGSPSASGVFNYTLTTSGGCTDTSVMGTITVTPDNTIALSSAIGTDGQTICVNTALTNITYATTGATGATITGLPAGVTGSWSGNVVTISGTPTTSVGSPFNYTVTLTGGCGTVSEVGTITVTPDNTIALSSAVGTDGQTICVNTALTNITYATTGATGATITGLPAGVTGSWSGNVVTISGTPTTSVGSPFNYTVTLTGGCGTVSTVGTITVTPDNTIALSSAIGTDGQTICVNTALTNITYATTGATGATITGLPAGVTGSWSGNVVTISGTPTTSVGSPFNYTITLTGGCGTVSEVGTITVTPDNTIALSSAIGTDGQTICVNTALTNITYATTGATGATITGLPAGVTGSWSGNVVTISGTPTTSVGSPFNYTITLTGGCGTVSTVGTITVTPDNTIALSSAIGTDAQTVCENTALTNITYATTGATGATITGLPAGVTGSWSGNVVTISGTPTTSVGSPFNYTVTLTGGCGTVSIIGRIGVISNNTINLSSAAGTDAQTICVNNVLNTILYDTTGATGATITGLPAGVTGSWSGNVVTISGTPTTSVGSPFNYTITLTGGCGTVSTVGTITVTPDNTIALSSAIGTDGQTICVNTTLTNITYATTGATGATITGLPAGVTGSWSGNVVTISGTPTTSVGSPFNYTITLTGGCGTVSTVGTITVTPDNTISLTSAVGTDSQSICVNTALTNITYATTGATGATITGLPAGVTGSWSGNVVTISGTPTTSVGSPFNYTVTLTGGCGTVSTVGTIGVVLNNSITLSSTIGTDGQTICVNTALTNITYATTGATGATITGLPAGVTGSWSGNVVTISGTPTTSVGSPFNYTITLTGGCGTVSEVGTITVTPDNTIALSSAIGTDGQTICVNTALTNITYATTGATGATITGLPAGVTGSWSGNVVTISGTPTTSVGSPFNYTITLTGGCGTVSEVGTITVTPDNTIALSSAIGTDGQTICVNTALTNITYATTGATGATITGLPAGVTGSWSGNVVTISGTPTTSVGSPFNYTVTLTGGCGTVSTVGTITVTPDNTISLSSAIGTDGQTICVNTALTNITYATTGATGATITGLPAGVTGSWSGNVVTISGTPTTSVGSPFNYTITLTGGCGTVSTVGTITVTPDNTISLTSAVGTDSQSICVNTALTNITYATTGATGATITGLPAGVTGSWSGNVVTISGTPTTSVGSPFNYTVTLTGGCGTVSTVGTIGVVLNNSITLSSAIGTDGQTICVNTALTNITYATTGATGATITGLPAGVTGSWSGNVVTISGTPTTSVGSPFNYTITLTGGCGTVSEVGTITVTPDNTISLSSAIGTDGQTICVNTALTNITYATTGATGATITGLPAGVTGSWSGNVVTISGTPTTSVGSPFNYTVTLTGGCGTVSTVGTITVTPDNTISLSSAIGTDGQTICVNTALTNITYATTGATGATITGLPAGVTGSWSGNVVTISGTPTTSVGSPFNYTVTLTGGCGTVSEVGTITVTPDNTIALSSAIGTDGQTICVNTALTNITYATTGATGATITGLPAGVTGSWSGNVVTISGTPTTSVGSPFNYTITLTGGCGTVSEVGTITVTPDNTIALSSAIGTDGQTICVNTALTNITYATTGATGATITGLPAGVTGSWSGNVVTISGTPTTSVGSPFNYTVTLTGGCGTVSEVGTITVTPDNTIALSSAIGTDGQTICVNTALTNITYATTGATGATITGLPAGVTGSWSGNVVTISGTPTTSVGSPFNYTVTLTGGCGTVSTVGTITVTPDNTISLSSAIGTDGQTICVNTALTNITYATTGATGATITGLPAGVTGSWSGNVVTISGTPTTSVGSPFNYTITLTGGCGTVSEVGTITVTPDNTIALSSAIGTDGQTICVNTALTNITYATTGATGATITGLPAGVTGSWSGNVVTISGTPTTSVGSPFNYTVTLTGGCGTVSEVGTITVTPDNTIALSSAIGTDGQTICVNTALTNITYATTGATGATITGLPAGVTGSWSGNVVTISGTPTTSVGSPFNYTITLTGGCGTVSEVGTITVTPDNTISLSSAIGTDGQTICVNTALTNITYATTGATGATITGLPAGVTGSWSGNVVTISGTPTTSVGSPFNYTVTLTGGCGTVSTVGTISVSEPPTATISYAQPEYCVSNTSVNVIISGTGNYTGGVYSSIPAGLSINSATGEINPSLSTPNSYTVNYEIPASGPCVSSIVSTTITITPRPTVIITNNLPSICSGSSTDIVLTSNVPGATFSWNAVGTNVSGSTNGTGTSINQILTTTSDLVGEVVYTVIATANGCSGDPIEVRVNINPIPDVVVTPTSETICSGTSTNISFSGSISGTVFNWTVVQSGVTGATSGTGTSIQQTLVTTSLISSGTATYTITPVLNGCSGTPVDVIVTVNPTPEILGTPTHLPICSGEFTNINVSAMDPATVFDYTVSAVGVIGATGGTITAGAPIAQQLETISNSQGYVDYTITPTLNGCSGTPIVIRVYVNPLPLPVLEDGVICVELSTGNVFQTYYFHTGLSNSTHTFVWYYEGVIIPGATSTSYEATAAGSYSVIATNIATGCSSLEVFGTVNATNPATSFTYTVTNAFTDNATIVVNVPDGNGTIMYQIDDEALQSSNIFTGVSPGMHVITVVDTQGCTYLTEEVMVIDYPKYFTPNGDGYNDYWNIIGLQNQPGAKLYIFDRYGKLIKQISTTGQGWDGTFNNQQLPSTDYWFTVEFEEAGQQKVFRAHFSLIR